MMKRYIMMEWKLYVKSVVVFTISRCAYLGLLYINMLMLDYLLAKDLEGLMVNLCLSLMVRYLWLGFNSYSGIVEGKLMACLNTDIRNDINGCLANMTYKEYNSSELGVYQSWLINDISKMDELGFSNFFMITHFCIDILIGTIAQCLINPLLLLTSLIVGALTLLFTKVNDGKMKNCSENVTDAMERFVAKTHEFLAGLFVFRGFDCKGLFMTRTAAESKLLEECNFNYKKEHIKSYMFTSFFSCILGLVQTFVMCILIIFGKIPVHVIFGGGNILSLVGDSLNNIASCRIPLVSAKVYFDKVEKLMNERIISDKTLVADGEKAIRFQNVSFGYDEKKIFEKYSYTFEIGKKYAVCGPSGTGKTTLLKLMTGYNQDYTGSIFMDNVDIKNLSEEALFEKITYIAQDTFLFNDSIINNIKLGNEYTKEEIDEAIKKASLTEDVAEMEKGLDTIVGENGNLLSGGQKQRVGLARAFLHNKRILLIDEGTSSLDRQNAENVVNNLLEDADLTVIFVSHTLSDETLNRFDRIVAL